MKLREREKNKFIVYNKTVWNFRLCWMCVGWCCCYNTSLTLIMNQIAFNIKKNTRPCLSFVYYEIILTLINHYLLKFRFQIPNTHVYLGMLIYFVLCNFLIKKKKSQLIWNEFFQLVFCYLKQLSCFQVFSNNSLEQMSRRERENIGEIKLCLFFFKKSI